MNAPSARFDRLYRETSGQIFKLALSLTGRPEDAHDLTQETFSKAWKAWPEFRQDSEFSTWVYRICVNAAKDRLRQRRRLPIQVFTEDWGIPFDDIVEAHPVDDPVTLALAGDIRLKCLYAFSECLPRRQRQVFCLNHVMGFDHKTIAGILGCQVGAVKASLFRARQRIGGYLNGRCTFLKADNPCDCRQWVRFALQHGIVRLPSGSEDERQAALVAKADRVRQEIGSLVQTRQLYDQTFGSRADQEFQLRLREGIGQNEWSSL
jgi:RNA polymerase sigma-70 factor (ECF subfamily)